MIILSTKTGSVIKRINYHKGSKQRGCVNQHAITLKPSHCQEIIQDDIRDKAH